MGKASGNCERKMTTHKRKTSRMLRARQSRKIPPTNGMANTNSSNNHRKFKWLHVGFSWGFPGVFRGFSGGFSLDPEHELMMRWPINTHMLPTRRLNKTQVNYKK